MDRNKYMRQYWETHPAQYDKHKSNITFNRNVKKFTKIIDKMIFKIIMYDIENNKGMIHNGETQIILNGNYTTSETI